MKKNEKGFSAVEVVLVIVILTILGVVSWLVYDRNKTKKTDNATSDTTYQVPITKPIIKKDITADWLTYKASGYTIRFADGWTLMKKESSNDSFVVANNDNLKYRAGQKAVIKNYVSSSSGDSQYGLYMDYSGPRDEFNKNVCSDSENLKPAYNTAGGNSVYTQTVEGGSDSPQASLLKAGDKRYTYCVQLGDRTLVIGYNLASGNEDHSSTIEKVVKTIK